MIAAAGYRSQGADGARRLRIAVPKGALFRESVDALRKAGLDVGGLPDPGRQLVITTDEMEFVIGKPTDIPIYVAYGAVDIGISGKDVLAESALDVVEMVDLKFGACKFVIAELENTHKSIEEQYRHLGVIRIATKYPRITEEYFGRRGIQVEVVKLNGNIEIAPLIGIADWIVDITQTGTTLRENKLRVVEDVLESSARFIANPVSLRTESKRVMELASRLAEGSIQ